jgi:drug/metabolite transporter (DMT)-like permease
MHYAKSIFYLILASCQTSLMFVYLKKALLVSTLQSVLFFHFLFAFLLYLPFAKQIAPLRSNLLILRILTSLVTFFTLFISTKWIPVVNVSVMLNTAPFFVPLILRAIFKRAIPLYIWGLLFLGFLGILFVLQPEWSQFGSMSLFAMVGGFTSAISMIVTRKLLMEINVQTLNFYLLLSATLLMLPFAIANYAISAQLLVFCLISGILFASELFFFAKAFSFEKIEYLAPFNYLGVIFSLFFQYVFFANLPTLLSISGIILILGSATCVTFFYQKALRSTSK